ncbi:hypothetical protein [Alienimonas californiensis]|uniref:Lipoprotein n=1 Tax=Alienimonas californiensis TaxID=2527989 RepID=A0A517PCZ2_9PLAN|nr:hypothetical protein [Alienimonas californiensis]QDT17249.1 hypothetical protein CA12_33630 [Alienimonas californiensis]
MRVPCGLLLVLAAAGCGDAEYLADFKGNTVPYYAQRQALDAALAAPWQYAGISLRTPRGFSAVSPPPKPTKEQLEDEFFIPPPDPRQPTYLLDPLPGLKGAWKGPLPPAGEQAGQRWLYVLDSRNLDDDPVAPNLDPDQFVEEITDRFARAMNLRTPEPQSFQSMPFPRSAAPFARPVQYSTPPKPLIGEFGDEQIHRVELYVYDSGGRKVIVALVMPEEAMIGPELGEPRDLMLQTLEVGMPSATPQPGGGGAPAGGPVF